MVRQPETHYAKGPEGNLAYQVVGDGPMDLVVVPGWFSHVDMLWGDPGWVSFVGELASFARVILYDKRGTGLSDPVDGVPTPESRADDLRAVLDAAGSDRVALFGFSEGGPISVLFAASIPTVSGRLSCTGRSPAGTLTTMVRRAGLNGKSIWPTSGLQSTIGGRDARLIGRRPASAVAPCTAGPWARWKEPA
jgi:pimeloyl-ACP methyl ester carboxylesterase